MLKALDNALLKGLFFVYGGLLFWGCLGLLEYMFPSLSFGLQSGSFPAGLQFIHFFALILTGSLFVFGYVRRWSMTPHAAITMYAVLATICFVETIDFGAFGGGSSGVMIMLVEYTLYGALSIYLLRSTAVKDRFRTAEHR